MNIKSGFGADIEFYDYDGNLYTIHDTNTDNNVRDSYDMYENAIYELSDYLKWNYSKQFLGKEIDYDFKTNSIVIDLTKYMDKKVKNGTDENVLKELIINTYTTILTRGIKGCYVYACNSNLRNYLKKYISTANNVTLERK